MHMYTTDLHRSNKLFSEKPNERNREFLGQIYLCI